MKKAGFYIFYLFAWTLALLPLPVLYLFSDLLFVLLYYFPSYRRDIVIMNLRNSFPEKGEKELRMIERRFYSHLADLFVETISVIHISRKQILKRFRFRNMSLLDRFYNEGRDVAAVCSHYNNWEWLSSMPLQSPFTAMTVYKPLKNKYFDKLMHDLRAKFGVVPAPMQVVLREILKQRKNRKLTVTAFIADQTPTPGDSVYWTTFLNQETGFYTGTEKIAVMLDMPVIFVHIIKVKRGCYEVELSLISEHPKEEAGGVITGRHVRKLEEIIKECPEHWLWSHRRWKYKREKNG